MTVPDILLYFIMAFPALFSSVEGWMWIPTTAFGVSVMLDFFEYVVVYFSYHSAPHLSVYRFGVSFGMSAMILAAVVEIVGTGPFARLGAIAEWLALIFPVWLVVETGCAIVMCVVMLTQLRRTIALAKSDRARFILGTQKA
jgi:hypothetical protein